jgi:hypothetical protein
VSQPETVTPTMSKAPIAASSPAAWTSPIPWSCAAGIRWVPITPTVVAPQMKKVPASSQNARERAPTTRAPAVAAKGLRGAATGGSTARPP